MNQPTGSPYTVLILDDDVAFVLWLGEIFVENGCQAFPALHSRQAVTFANKLVRPVDILVVNPNLPGAKRTVQSLSRLQPSLRVLFIQNEQGAARDLDGVPHLRLERPTGFEHISRPQWVMKIRRVLMRSAGEA